MGVLSGWKTSCHNPFNGGYYPVNMSIKEGDALMATDPKKFKDEVQCSHASSVVLYYCRCPFSIGGGEEGGCYEQNRRAKV